MRDKEAAYRTNNNIKGEKKGENKETVSSHSQNNVEAHSLSVKTQLAGHTHLMSSVLSPL